MTFGRTIPALPVRDIAVASSFYADRLGYTVAHAEDGFARVVRDDCELHLWRAADRTWMTRKDLRERGDVGVLHPGMGGEPQVTEWGTSDVHVLDADGNLLTYFAPRTGNP